MGMDGYLSLEGELRITLPILIKNKDRIEANREAIDPKIQWSA